MALNSDATDLSTLVLSTVEHLQELGRRLSGLKLEKGNEQEISEIIQIIIDTLHELDCGRLKVYENLEAETIKASIHRHKLAPFAEEIEIEIRGAVAAARESNEFEISKLQGKIDEILIETGELEENYKFLSVESCSLEPSKDELESEHDKIVALLNQTLTDRANLQIKLNETRDHLRESYQKINDIENALVEIEIEMKEDQVEAKLNKEKLEKSDFETKKKIKEQVALNLDKSKEIKQVKTELHEKEIELDDKKKEIRQLETSKSRLEANQVQLSRQIKKEVKENAALTQEGMKILEAGAGNSQKLLEAQNELKQTKSAIGSEMTKATDEFKRLHSEKIKLSNELETAKCLGIREKDEAEMMQKKLRNAKNNLLSETDECSRLKRVNTELESSIEQLLQDHQAIVELLNKQIGDFTVNLAAERKERQLLQSKRDEVTKETNEFKSEYGKLMAGVTKKINNGKTEHQKLTNLGILLQKSLKQDEADISNKQNQLKNEKEKLSKTQISCESSIIQLQDTIAKLEKEIEETSELVKERTPQFEQLERSFKQKTSDFEEMKKYIVDLKNKRAGIETSISTTKQKIFKMQNPQNLIQDQISENRKRNMNELKLQTDALKKKENEIFFHERRLALIKAENLKMSQAIKQMQSESEFMTKRTNTLQNGTINSDEHIQKYKDWLDEKWREDMKLEREYCNRDIPYIEDLMNIQTAAISREARVDEVHSKLQEQLQILADFIDSVAGLRQK